MYGLVWLPVPSHQPGQDDHGFAGSLPRWPLGISLGMFSRPCRALAKSHLMKLFRGDTSSGQDPHSKLCRQASMHRTTCPLPPSPSLSSFDPNGHAHEPLWVRTRYGSIASGAKHRLNQRSSRLNRRHTAGRASPRACWPRSVFRASNSGARCRDAEIAERHWQYSLVHALLCCSALSG